MKYILQAVNVNKVLMMNEGYIRNRILKFNPKGLGFVQHIAVNGANKQHCHDISQKSTDIPGRVP